MLGGTDPAISNLVPSDVIFGGTTCTKPREWRGLKWTVKNLFELKNARRVVVESNVLEYNWQAGQPGYAIVLTPRNAGGSSPWATVEDVVFRSNVVRHVAAAFNILGEDNNRPSGPARRIQILNNLFFDVNNSAWGGNGAFLQLGNGPTDVHVQHNTILQTGNLISAYGGTKDAPVPIVGFVFEDNIARHNRFGVFGNGRSLRPRYALDVFSRRDLHAQRACRRRRVEISRRQLLPEPARARASVHRLRRGGLSARRDQWAQDSGFRR